MQGRGIVGVHPVAFLSWQNLKKYEICENGTVKSRGILRNKRKGNFGWREKRTKKE